MRQGILELTLNTIERNIDQIIAMLEEMKNKKDKQTDEEDEEIELPLINKNIDEDKKYVQYVQPTMITKNELIIIHLVNLLNEMPKDIAFSYVEKYCKELIELAVWIDSTSIVQLKGHAELLPILIKILKKEE